MRNGRIINEVYSRGKKERKWTRNQGLGEGGRLFKYSEAVELITSAMSFVRGC
jgi:hypothetical protein